MFMYCLQYPSSPELLKKFGFKSYHCYNYGLLADIDSYLALDAANGVESAAIMWGSMPRPNQSDTLVAVHSCSTRIIA